MYVICLFQAIIETSTLKASSRIMSVNKNKSCFEWLTNQKAVHNLKFGLISYDMGEADF